MVTVRGNGKVAKKVPRAYRLRADIVSEVEGMLKLVNNGLGVYDEGYVSETFVVESALALYVKKFKTGLSAISAIKGNEGVVG
jgi:hypothetical protein